MHARINLDAGISGVNELNRSVAGPTTAAPLLVDEGHSGKRVGTFIMVAALLSALVGFLIVAGLTPIAPTNAVVLSILATNSVLVICLVDRGHHRGARGLARETRARRGRRAAYALHRLVRRESRPFRRCSSRS